jgi:hypothetical protein
VEQWLDSLNADLRWEREDLDNSDSDSQHSGQSSNNSGLAAFKFYSALVT